MERWIVRLELVHRIQRNGDSQSKVEAAALPPPTHPTRLTLHMFTPY